MAFVDGRHYFADHKDFVLRVMQKYTRLSNQEVHSKSCDYFARRTVLVPLTDPAVLRNVVPADRASGRSLEDFYDNPVLQELMNGGFLDKDGNKQR